MEAPREWGWDDKPPSTTNGTATRNMNLIAICLILSTRMVIQGLFWVQNRCACHPIQGEESARADAGDADSSCRDLLPWRLRAKLRAPQRNEDDDPEGIKDELRRAKEQVEQLKKENCKWLRC